MNGKSEEREKGHKLTFPLFVSSFNKIDALSENLLYFLSLLELMTRRDGDDDESYGMKARKSITNAPSNLFTRMMEEKPIKVIIIVHDGEKLVIRMMAMMWRG